jgi:hypothetical protein
MEDDVGIYDPTGLPMFASYFCDALLNGVSVVRSSSFYPLAADSKQLAVRLIYNIGNMRLEGLLKLQLLHQNLDLLVFDMMVASSRININSQVFIY